MPTLLRKKFEFSFEVGNDWHLSGPVYGCRYKGSTANQAYCVQTYNGDEIEYDDSDGCTEDELCHYQTSNQPWARIYFYSHQFPVNDIDKGRIWFDSVQLKITDVKNIDAGPYSYNILSLPDHGTLSYISPADGSEISIDDYPYLISIDSWNNGSECFKYTPDANYPSGEDVSEFGIGSDNGLNYKVIDSGTSAAHGLESNVANIIF